MELTLIGLGINSGDLSFSAFEKIKSSECVIVRTELAESVKFLKEQGISYISLDDEYRKSRNFDTLSKNLAKRVLSLSKEKSCCYLVDGAVSEDSSCKIILKKHKNACVYEGVSKAKYALTRCGIASPSFSTYSAYDLDKFSRFTFPLVIFDLDNFVLASEWKIKLSEFIDEEQKVWLYIDKQPKLISLYELDRFISYDYSTAVVVDEIPLLEKTRFDFDDLFDIVELLRAPNGCPWDREQTPESIRKNLIEECYELADAIDQSDDDKICEEIGDVILQAVFHLIFAKERGAFSKTDALSDECAKLIFRHSHIFGKDKATNASGALDVWDKNKQIEKGFSTPSDYVLDVPKSFPALLRTQKSIKRVSKYQKSDATFSSIKHAINEILEKLEKGENAVKNSGSLLFLACLILKKLGVDGEESLYFAVDNFVSEFAKTEKDFDCEKYVESLIN